MKRKVSATTRLLHDLFTQYQSTFLAFCELLNNSIQADAKNIDVIVDYPSEKDLSPVAIKQIIINDDGVGVHQNNIQDRLMDFGDSGKKGGKGIGRFAALQIGSDVTVETVGFDEGSNSFSKVIIPFSESYIKSVKKIEDLEIDTDEKILKGKHSTYYKVTINNIYDPVITGKNQKRKISERLLKENIHNAIFERYPLLIFSKSVKFKVNNTLLLPEQFIHGEPEKIKVIFKDKKGKEHELFFTYIQLKSTIDEIRVFLTKKNAGVDAIVSGFQYDADWLSPKSKGWFVYIHSDVLDTDLYRNLDLGELDGNVHDFKSFIKDKLNLFFKGKNKEYEAFITKLKADSFYPYKENNKATSKSKVILFEKVAYLVEERYNLFTVNKSLREIIYPLIDRTITTGELDKILQKILRLDTKHVKKFNELLDRSELEDVIGFSEKVSRKMEDLEFLEKLTCTELLKHVAERKELHKIMEKMLWVFGEKYLDTTQLLSDTNLQNNLLKLREESLIFKPSKKDGNINLDIDPKARSITDLFIYSEKPIDEVTREILIVELKAPKVKISPIELAQVKKYAREIEQSSFYSEDINFHIVLISSEINKDAKFETNASPKDRENPYLFFQNENKNIFISVMKWAHLIENNKRKLKYLSAKLKIKDVDVEEKIKNDFDEISFDKVKSVLRKVAVPE
ncbi:MAG: ATP-binding protein [Ferruginibacter sp.]